MAKSIIFFLFAVAQTITGQCIEPYDPGFPGPVVGPALEAYGQCIEPYDPGFPGPIVGPALEAYGQCIEPYDPGFPGPIVGPALEAYGPGYGPIPGITSKASFRVTSSSAIQPRGLTVQTDSLAIEGPLAVTGRLPFLSAVVLEGQLPSIGQGAVSYGCEGNVGILNEVGPTLGPFGYPDSRAGYGYPNGCSRGPYIR